jgi:hypothetical protein
VHVAQSSRVRTGAKCIPILSLRPIGYRECEIVVVQCGEVDSNICVYHLIFYYKPRVIQSPTHTPNLPAWHIVMYRVLILSWLCAILITVHVSALPDCAGGGVGIGDVCLIPCPDEQFANPATNYSCTATRTCNNAIEYESHPPTLTADRRCKCRDDLLGNTNQSTPYVLDTEAPVSVSSAILCPDTPDFYSFNAAYADARFVLVLNFTTAAQRVLVVIPADGAQLLEDLELVGGRVSTHDIKVNMSGHHLIAIASQGGEARAAYSLSFRAVWSCQPGWHELGPNDCRPCPQGTYQNIADQRHCIPCAAGTFSKSAASMCTACPVQTYTATAGSSVCHTCPPKAFTNTTGSTSCTHCGSLCPNITAPSPPPSPTYLHGRGIYSIFTILVRLVHTAPTPTVNMTLVAAGVLDNFGLDVDFALIIDPNYTPAVYGNYLYLPLVSNNDSPLIEVGSSLQAHEHYFYVGADTHADFTEVRLFATQLARCQQGVYPLLPASDNNAVYPLVTSSTISTPISYIAPPEIRNTTTPCPEESCMPGYVGENCAVRGALPAPLIPVIHGTSLAPGKAAQIMMGVIGAMCLLVLIGVYVSQAISMRATKAYTPVNTFP